MFSMLCERQGSFHICAFLLFYFFLIWKGGSASRVLKASFFKFTPSNELSTGPGMWTVLKKWMRASPFKRKEHVHSRRFENRGENEPPPLQARPLQRGRKVLQLVWKPECMPLYLHDWGHPHILHRLLRRTGSSNHSAAWEAASAKMWGKTVLSETSRVTP